MANERNTENIVREHFKNDPLYNVIKIEEQKSSNKKIIELLQTASKSGNGAGRPEFIISFPSQNSDYLILIECKASIAKHQSPNLDNPKDYGVDGALHYAQFFKNDFDILIIAVSGENEAELKVSTFKWLKGEATYKDENTTVLLSVNDYLKILDNEIFLENIKNIDIIQKSVFLNEEFQSYSITENSRCTIISAILLSLLDNTFKTSYVTYENSSELAQGLLDALKRVLSKNSVRNQDSMLGEFQTITNEPIFKQLKIKRKKEDILTIEIAKNFINYIYKNVYPLIKMEDAGIDILGKFYTEFIRYAGSSKSQGLVLTPFHITDLFCDLANITADSYVYDPCCGSGGFLIAAMKRMLDLAGNDTNKKNYIKSHQLIGAERRADMFTYACSNMLFRGDGKSNIYCGDCFNLEEQISSSHQLTTTFLNPPYDVSPAGQMEFIEHGLRIFGKRNGIVVAIVQMSCAIKNDNDLIAVKSRLLQSHKLKAVISMPDELFNPSASVPTCIMVWEANKPNDNTKTWFGYLKDDGFEKRKHRGRLDIKKKWQHIKKVFVDAYTENDEIAGLSVKKAITGKDEWCAEAYIETNYSILSKQLFQKTIINFISTKIKQQLVDIEVIPANLIAIELNTQNNHWKSFDLKQLFSIDKGERLTQPDRIKGDENLPLLTASSENNGISDYISYDDFVDNKKIFEDKITIDMFFNVFYHPYKYFSDDNVHTLVPKNENINRYVSLFLVTILKQLQYRYAYGRQFRLSRFPYETIKLPADANGNPDWLFMENYIKTLNYSKSI